MDWELVCKKNLLQDAAWSWRSERYKNNPSSAFHEFYEAQISQVKAGHDQ
jgi:hypothetical protein